MILNNNTQNNQHQTDGSTWDSSSKDSSWGDCSLSLFRLSFSMTTAKVIYDSLLTSPRWKPNVTDRVASVSEIKWQDTRRCMVATRLDLDRMKDDLNCTDILRISLAALA